MFFKMNLKGGLNCVFDSLVFKSACHQNPCQIVFQLQIPCTDRSYDSRGQASTREHLLFLVPKSKP